MTETADRTRAAGTSLIRARWFPAAVVLPGRPQPASRCMVILAEGGEHHGMHVWFTRPNGAETADWHRGVNWSRFTVPEQRTWRTGVEVLLSDGASAIVTPGGGCKCGSLGRWAGPSWANTTGLRRA